MKQGHAIALQLAAVVVAALIHVRWHPEQHQAGQVEPESDAVDPTPWFDWLYTTRLLALEQSGDLDFALAVWEGYRPRQTRGLDPEPEWAAKAYAELCYRMGRRACFLTLYVQLMGQIFEDEPGLDFTMMARLPGLGVDRARFLRGLVYEFPSPKDERSARPEVDPFSLALAIERARLTDVMLPWLRQEASNRELDDHNRSRAERTLHYLREQAGSLVRLPRSARDERK